MRKRGEKARLLGAATSEQSAKRPPRTAQVAQAENNGRPRRPLVGDTCTCGRGKAVEGHPTTCARAALFGGGRRRAAAYTNVTQSDLDRWANATYTAWHHASMPTSLHRGAGRTGPWSTWRTRRRQAGTPYQALVDAGAAPVESWCAARGSAAPAGHARYTPPTGAATVGL